MDKKEYTYNPQAFEEKTEYTSSVLNFLLVNVTLSHIRNSLIVNDNICSSKENL